MRLVAFIIAIFFLQTCDFNDNHNKTYTHYLIESDVANFNIDDSTSYRSNLFSVFNIEDQEFLAFQNQFKKSITIFSLTDYRLFKEIRVPVEGPYSLDKPYGFTIINYDSIFVYDAYHLSNVLLLDFNGRIIDRLDFGKNDEFFSHASMTRNPDIYFNNEIYFVELPRDPYKDSVSFEYSYNIRKKELISREVSLPEIYQEYKWGTFHAYPNRSKGPGSTFLYSWGIDPNIYVVDFESGQMKAFLAKSDFFRAIRPMNSTKVSAEDNMKYYIENDIYDVIVWDEYRKVYYRFARQGIPYVINKSGQIANGENKPCSIIILDENFNKIGETILPVGKYFVRDFFVCSKGLFISNSHYLNPELDESQMSFTIFKLDSLVE